MEPRSLHQIATACGGTLLRGDPAALITRIGTDSRQIRDGDLFLALRGERHDGHAYLAAAADRGAAAVLGERAALDAAPARCAAIAVDDSRGALGAIATDYRLAFGLPVVAVGGSNGKTGTKDMIAAVLGEGSSVVASEASFNNDIGVPLTLLRLDRGCTAAVVEVGTNHPGELPALVRMIRPTIGVVTSLGREHLEFFGSLAGVIQEEGWLAELLPADGTLLVNADSPGTDQVVARTQAAVVRVGWDPRADWRVLSAELEGGGTRFELAAPTAAHDGSYWVPALGRHQAVNAGFAIAVGAALGRSRAACQAGLAVCRPPKRRLQLIGLRGIGVLDDCYNANADSMGAALDVLKSLPCSGRRLAVLGDMAELGPHSPSAHAEVGGRAAGVVAELFTTGRMAPVVAQAAHAAGLRTVREFADVCALAEAVAGAVRPGDLVLVKASRAAGFERVVEDLTARLGPAAG